MMVVVVVALTRRVPTASAERVGVCSCVFVVEGFGCLWPACVGSKPLPPENLITHHATNFIPTRVFFIC